MHRTLRTAGWLAVAGLLGAALVTPMSSLATQPSPDHKVTICHRTASDTNPYLEITVDIASSGHLQGGHDTEHQGPIWSPGLKDQHIEWGDIIPPYTYLEFSYAGQNWTEEGQAILANQCAIPAKESPSASLPEESGSPSGSVEGETGTPTPSGNVEGETGTPRHTPPTTDTVSATTTPSGSGLQLMLLGIAALLTIALMVGPASRKVGR